MAVNRQSVLSPEKENEARELVGRLRQLTEDELLNLARLLVNKPDEEIFGETETQLRDLLLQLGGKIVEEHLREKKTATAAAASSVPSVSKPRNSRTTAARLS